MSYSIRDYIIEQLPQIEGYGNCGQVFKDKIPNHAVFKQSLRNDHEGDVGIFIMRNEPDNTIAHSPFRKAVIHIYVNAVAGDVEGSEQYLSCLSNNLRKSKGNGKIKIIDCIETNLSAGGKNTNGIHWSVLNILIKYRIV